MARMNRDERAARLCTEHGLFTADAGFVVDEQDRREGPLVEFIRSVAGSAQCRSPHCLCKSCKAHKVLAQYEALDAKPEPTLLEAAKEMLATVERGGMTQSVVDALKAAVEREESKR